MSKRRLEPVGERLRSPDRDAATGPRPREDSIRALAASIGNRAFGHLLQEKAVPPAALGATGLLLRQPPAGNTTAPAPAPTGGEPAAAGAGGPVVGAPAADWDASGNLRGSPPVRERKHPPNTAVVEDESEYHALLAQARASLARQQARADTLYDSKTNTIKDFRWFFAKVYSHVTENEIAFCEGGAYYYPGYVLRCVLYFEQIYDDNFKAFEAGGPVEAHWKRAFEQCKTSKEAVDHARAVRDVSFLGGSLGALGESNLLYKEVMEAGEALTISMKAHIRFDLPRAEAWVFNSRYAAMPDVHQKDFQADFFSMSGVFDQAARDFAPEMAKAIGVPTDLVPQLMQDTSMRWIFSADMGTERADTWQRALELGGSAGPSPYTEDPASHALTGNVVAGPDGQGNLAAIGALPGGLAPSMDQPRDSGSDTDIREEIARLSPADIAKLSVVERVQRIRRLLRGWTGGADEAAMLKILRASPSDDDLVQVLDAADVWDLCYATDGASYKALRREMLLGRNYYGRTAQQTALRLVYKCMDGETAEWEEQMIADVVETRNDRVALVSAVGAHYGASMRGSTDFQKGLNKLEWQLDGEDESRVHAALKTDPAAPQSESGLWW